MSRLRLPLLAAAAVGLAALAARAADKPCFEYDPKKTDVYFGEKLAPAPPGDDASRALAAIMKAQVLEAAEKDWGPWVFFSLPVVGDSRDGVYLNAPDELLVALALAHPLLDEAGRAAALAAADREFAANPPFRRPWKEFGGPWRGWYDVAGAVAKGDVRPGPWMPEPERRVACFKTLYGVWAYADAFGRWDTVRSAWPEIRALKDQVAKAWTFRPAWNPKAPGGPGVLTAKVAAEPRHQHELLRRLFTGPYVFYENPWPEDEAERNVLKQFRYAKVLSALVGYGRIAEKMGEAGEAAWAKERFAFVARQALETRTAPFYWATPDLVPEVARMLRDHAGPYLDKVMARPSVLVGTAKDGFPNDGPWYRVIDTQHWYVAHAGSNGAGPPGAAMSGFLGQAWLCGAPAARLDDWTDVPWCQADYWYIEKCAAAVNAYGKAGWVEAK